MQHNDEIIVSKIIREIDFALNRIRGMQLENFVDDIDAQHSVGMAVINVGELIKHLSVEVRESNEDIPWRQAAGLRDIAAHTYDTIRMDDLYETVIVDFPPLREKLLGIR